MCVGRNFLFIHIFVNGCKNNTIKEIIYEYKINENLMILHFI